MNISSHTHTFVGSVCVSASSVPGSVLGPGHTTDKADEIAPLHGASTPVGEREEDKQYRINEVHNMSLKSAREREKAARRTKQYNWKRQ